jgi:CHAT domain
LTPLAGLEAAWDRITPTGVPESIRPSTDPPSGLLAFQGLNPVQQPPRVRIGPRLRLDPLAPALDEIDVDTALDAIAPRTWYWTGATVIDQYYWAVRSPNGAWSHGRSSMAPGAEAATAYMALGRALPFSAPDEDAHGVSRRVTDGPLGRSADHSRERRLLREVARAFLPAPLSEGLLSEPAPVRLVVSLPAALGHLPVAGLPLDDVSDLRVVEKSTVVHVPSWSVATAAQAAMNGRAHRWPTRLALFAPSGGRDVKDLEDLANPHGVERTLVGPLSRTQVRDALHAVSADRNWLLTIIGHVDHNQDKPSESGLRLSDGHLTMTDLIGIDPAQRITVPERVLLIGCGSIGFASPAPEPRLTPTSEWLGLGAAVVLAGATDVCCTLYTVYANAQMRRIVDGLIDGLSSAISAPEALRQVQLAELNRWRSIGDDFPLQWLALAYVGTGWDR